MAKLCCIIECLLIGCLLGHCLGMSPAEPTCHLFQWCAICLWSSTVALCCHLPLPSVLPSSTISRWCCFTNQVQCVFLNTIYVYEKSETCRKFFHSQCCTLMVYIQILNYNNNHWSVFAQFIVFFCSCMSRCNLFFQVLDYSVLGLHNLLFLPGVLWRITYTYVGWEWPNATYRYMYTVL